MATEIWVNIGSGNGLLPDGTKPLLKPDVDWSLAKSSDIHIRTISQEMPQISIKKICLKITYLKFYPKLPMDQWVNMIFVRFQILKQKC